MPGKLAAYSVFALAIILSARAQAAGSESLTARDIVERAYQAAGGDNWRRPSTLQLTGQAWLYRDGFLEQATFSDDYRMWRIFPDSSGDAHVANGMVRFDASSEGKLLFQISYDGEHSYNQNGRIDSEDANTRWASNFGFGIIRFALDEGFTVNRMADDRVDGHPVYSIKVTDPAGKDTLFGIDKENFRVRMVGFDTPRGWHHRIYDIFRWHESPRFLQPTRVRLYYNGVKTNDIVWETVRVNERLDRSLFTLE